LLVESGTASVAVGGTGVAVGGSGVGVGGTGVAVGGMGVGAPHAAANNMTTTRPMVNDSTFRFIFRLLLLKLLAQALVMQAGGQLTALRAGIRRQRPQIVYQLLEAGEADPLIGLDVLQRSPPCGAFLTA
jgi:hypothetical protein